MPNITAPTTIASTLAEVKLRSANSRSGSTGSTVRDSARAKAAAEPIAKTAKPTIWRLSHGYCDPAQVVRSTIEVMVRARVAMPATSMRARRRVTGTCRNSAHQPRASSPRGMLR